MNTQHKICNMKQKKKKITIEGLAQITAKGFGEMDKRFDKTATKLDIERLEAEINELRRDIAFVQSMPARLERRVDALEDGLRIVKTKLRMR